MAADDPDGEPSKARPRPPPPHLLANHNDKGDDDHEQQQQQQLLTPRAAAAAAAARIQDNLLDVEQLRGAAHTSTKPAKFSAVLWRGALKILFFPLAYPWWRARRVGPGLFALGCALYVLQAAASLAVLVGPRRQQQEGGGSRLLLLLACIPPEGTDAARQLATEVTIPIVLWLVAAVFYGHLVAASQPEHKSYYYSGAAAAALSSAAAASTAAASAASAAASAAATASAAAAAAAAATSAAGAPGPSPRGRSGSSGGGLPPVASVGPPVGGNGTASNGPGGVDKGESDGLPQQQQQQQEEEPAGVPAGVEEEEEEDEDEDDEEDEDEDDNGSVSDDDLAPDRRGPPHHHHHHHHHPHHQEELHEEEAQQQQQQQQMLGSPATAAAGAGPVNGPGQSAAAGAGAGARAPSPAFSAGGGGMGIPGGLSGGIGGGANNAISLSRSRTASPMVGAGAGATGVGRRSSAGSVGAGGGGGGGGGGGPSAAADDEDNMLMRGLGIAGAGGGTGGGGGATVRVTLFDRRGERFKTSMTLSQIRRHIVDRASSTRQSWVYRQAALLGAVLAATVPRLYHLWVGFSQAQAQAPGRPAEAAGSSSSSATCGAAAAAAGEAGLLPWLLASGQPGAFGGCDALLLGVRLVSMATVFFIAWPMFRQLSITEYTYKRRYKYSKYFAAITSLSKARRYDIPHFSLKNVLNIKMWLALRAGRSWLRRYEAQRIADTVVSSTFLTVLFLLAVLVFEVFMNRDKAPVPFLTQLLHWELLVWGGTCSFFLLRFFSLGSRINEKYHDTGVLLTEQINVQLRIFETCCRRDLDTGKAKAKREKLQIADKVLSLAQKLLKELDSPSTVQGLNMSPTLYNVTRAVLFSALSAAASDTLGFKLQPKFMK